MRVLHRSQIVAALRAFVQVHDHRRDMAHVEVDGEAEDDQLHYRNEQRDNQRSPVAFQVQYLFGRDAPKSVQEIFHEV